MLEKLVQVSITATQLQLLLCYAELAKSELVCKQSKRFKPMPRDQKRIEELDQLIKILQIAAR